MLPTLTRRAGLLTSVSRRALSTSWTASQKASDPIQQVFVDKVREYAQKKSASGGKLVDADAKTQANLNKELEKVAKNFGGAAGVDMTKFPDLKFEEPKLEDVDIK